MDAYPVEDVGVENFNSGIGFTPATWPVNTRVTLCNVPWDSDYNNVIFFETTTERDNYFSGLASSSIVLTGLTYCKPNEPVYINTPYSRAYTYNYLIVENPAQPVPGEVTPPKLFYFVTAVSMIAPNTTGLYLQLDVWTTYQHTLMLGTCFVERGHVAWHAYDRMLSTSNRPTHWAKRYLMAPEGLDLGSSYYEYHEEKHALYDVAFGPSSPGRNSGFAYIIVSAADLEGNYGAIDAPLIPVSTTSEVNGMLSGCNVYYLGARYFREFFGLMQRYPWITSQIFKIFIFPDCFIPIGSQVNIGPGAYPSTGASTSATVPAYKIGYAPHALSANLMTISNLSAKSSTVLNTHWYAHPKAKTFPFSYIQLHNYVSPPVVLHWELLPEDSLTLGGFSSLAPDKPCIYVFPKGYGYDTLTYYAASTEYGALYSAQTGAANPISQTIPYGSKLENALVWNEFPSVPITNDGYIMQLAATGGARYFAAENAQWMLDKSLANANVSYDNANRSLGAAQANQQLAYETQRQISQYNIGNLVGNSLRDTYNSLSGNAQGGINGLFGGLDVSQVINTTVAAANGSMANELGNQQFWNTQQAQQGNIDANYKLQQWAANGDYGQALAAIDANVRDAGATFPTTSGSYASGTFASLITNGLTYWYFSMHTVTRDYQNIISDYWNRHGYAVHEFITIGRNFELMTVVTYWKLQNAIVTACGGDEGVRQIMRGIFEKGVSIWGSPAMLSYNANQIAANRPITTIDALY